MSDKRELLPVLLSEKSRKIKGSIYNRMQVDFAYNSNHIEGSRLTHDQTRYIYETRTIDGTARIGRLLMLKQCLANNIVPFFINEEIKHFYYVGLKEWQLEEKKNRLLDVCLTMQDDMKAILNYFRIEYDKSELTSRELINKHI